MINNANVYAVFFGLGFIAGAIFMGALCLPW